MKENFRKEGKEEAVKSYLDLLQQPNILAYRYKCYKTYFPRAKHSNFTVEPLAAGRVSGN